MNDASLLPEKNSDSLLQSGLDVQITQLNNGLEKHHIKHDIIDHELQQNFTLIQIVQNLNARKLVYVCQTCLDQDEEHLVYCPYCGKMECRKCFRSFLDEDRQHCRHNYGQGSSCIMSCSVCGVFHDSENAKKQCRKCRPEKDLQDQSQKY